MPLKEAITLSVVVRTQARYMPEYAETLEFVFKQAPDLPGPFSQMKEFLDDWCERGYYMRGDISLSQEAHGVPIYPYHCINQIVYKRGYVNEQSVPATVDTSAV